MFEIAEKATKTFINDVNIYEKCGKMTELVFVAVISGIFTIVSIMLLNHNWFKRQELKYNLEMKKIKYRQKLNKLKLRQNDTPIEGIEKYTKFLPLLKSLDSEQIGDLIGILAGNEKEYDEESPIKDILDNIPASVIQGFLENLNKGQEKTAQQQLFE